MKIVAGLMVLSLSMATIQGSLGASNRNAVETTRFAIMRDGEKIGTHDVEIRRDGSETSVNIATELTVKVLFVTAYYLQQTASERWVNGLLVGLNSVTDNNGTRHEVSVRAASAGLEIEADGKASRLDQNVVPASFWNPAFLRRSIMLDTQDGKIFPFTVIDGGLEQVTIKGQPVRAHHYTVKGRYSQDVWYDEQGRFVRSKLVVTDGSVIMYELI